MLSKITSRKLDDLLSLEQRNLESKLALVFTCSFFVQHIVFTLLKSKYEYFRYYLNKQGKILKELNENSYNVYIIHVIVIGCIALIMLNTTIPSLLKYLTLVVSTWVLSNLIVYFYRRFIKSKI